MKIGIKENEFALRDDVALKCEQRAVRYLSEKSEARYWNNQLILTVGMGLCFAVVIFAVIGGMK